MVRYARQSDSSKEDCVVLRQPREAVRWHQRAVAQLALAGPIEVGRLDPPRPGDLESAPDSGQADGHDLLTDPVSGDDCNLVGRHGPAGGGIRRRVPPILSSPRLPKPEATAGSETVGITRHHRFLAARAQEGDQGEAAGSGFRRGVMTRRPTIPSVSCPSTVQTIRISVGFAGAVQSWLMLAPGRRWTCASPRARPRSSATKSGSNRPKFRTTSGTRSAAATLIVPGRQGYSFMPTTISRSGGGAHARTSAQHIRRHNRRTGGHRKVIA